MPNQEVIRRIKNFDEVALGYSEEQALLEASRCLNCKKPLCVEGCPVEINIPVFISYIKEKKYGDALRTIKEKNNLPAICGRVCPQENQCEKRCVLGKKYRPVAIGGLERFVADWDMQQGRIAEPQPAVPSGKKVAIVGSGPAGLTAAADLARLGHRVTIFEALHTAGGVLVYGIPEFRLPKSIVEKEIFGIRRLGVEIKTNMVVGKVHTVDELLAQGFEAVFIATGAGLPYFMDIPGENLNGVYSANEFLTRVNLMKAYLFPEYLTPIKLGEKVAVVGAGNVAMDSARTALRLGARETYIVYRRSEQEMPARAEEIEHAREEGVQFKLLTSPVEIKGDAKGWVKALICQRFELGEPDESGRRRPVAIPGSEYEMEVDTVIMAIGQGPNPLIGQTTPDLHLNRHGNIIADGNTGQTSKLAVFAGGDIVTGAATVIQAMGAGKKAARAIHEYLQNSSGQVSAP
ncbi:MAG TPA: NADPH-dependent glutamate synthase [Syntrophomonadaceae bacterium]|nr:NADPH-dependent glutamate synthase [Syntrophomonadaceae bacterium]HQE24201.1 NADPH-dependent glutamate synthase [Syntrophomonadaceae bacterium]